MNKLKMGALMCGASLLLSGCITFPAADSTKVQVVWDNPKALESCRYVDVVIGSQGHFYDYWLHADKTMVWGTINEMRNKVSALGGDTLYLYQPLDFAGSVTMMGTAYQCSPAN